MKPTGLALPALVILVVIPDFSSVQSMKEPPDTFGIYSSDAPLPLYGRDETWQIFVERGPLRQLLVSERDIESYDWDNQALILTAEASPRLEAPLGKFIVVLGARRLYGGVGLPWGSAMAVQYPVIYTESVAGRAVLFLRPRHDFGHPGRIQDAAWAEIAASEVRQRFVALGKLEQPRSEPRFQELLGAVARIRILAARATAQGMELDYDLSGRRAGAYQLREELSLRWGRYGASLGPSRQELLQLAAEPIRRRAVFLYRDLAAYSSSRHEENLAGTLDGRVPSPVWQLQVSLRPVPTEAENAALGLVEQYRLQPDRWGGSLLEDSQSATLPLDWSKLPDPTRRR